MISLLAHERGNRLVGRQGKNRMSRFQENAAEKVLANQAANIRRLSGKFRPGSVVAGKSRPLSTRPKPRMETNQRRVAEDVPGRQPRGKEACQVPETPFAKQRHG
jgi:hypothetical protein